MTDHEIRTTRTCPRCLRIMLATQVCTCDAEELVWDIDKLVGAVIDAYTLAPNDEDEKREAVKATIIRFGWIGGASYA